MKDGGIQSKPVPTSSTLKGESWDAKNDRIRDWYAEVQRPSKSVRFAHDDTYDRAQEGSVPAIHTEVPVHMRSHVQNQMVGVRPRTQASGPVGSSGNRDLTIARRPNMVVSTSINPNHRPVEYEEVRKEVPKVQPEPERKPGLFQTIFDVNHPQDASTHLELLITDDFEAELEMFSRLQRLGNFGAARNYFEATLEYYLDHPYVLVQYGQMLLDQGDYLAFERLNPVSVFGMNARTTPLAPQTVEGWNRNLSCFEIMDRCRGRALGARYKERSSSRECVVNYHDSDPDDGSHCSHFPDRKLLVRDIKARSDQAELELLRQNWRLLQAMSTIHRTGGYGDACSEAWYSIENIHFGATLCSTEVACLIISIPGAMIKTMAY